MDVVKVLHMNADNREFSYANNSILQKTVILKARKILEDTIKDYGSNGFPECFKVADLGCSSGPNALLFVTNMVDNVHALCQQENLKAPDEFQVFLNDLPSNDFNAVFRMIPPFYSKLENERGGENSVNCFICGVPGSFYTRLFPSNSLHFVHSSYSVHWLSQVPENLLDNNKGNIYMAKESPPSVFEAYFNQFKTDFTTFLRKRSKEIISNGRLVLALLGRSIADPTSKDCCYLFGLLAKSLEDLSAEGLVNEEDINSFNLPVYNPCIDELKAIIESEGTFSLDKLETIEVNWDMRDENEKIKSEKSSGKIMAKTVRAVLEPLLGTHFGYTCMDKLFERYAIHVTEHLSQEETNYFNIVISLTRKCK
ncbi:Salicylate carboxymethyltransferase [Heracleum sosnowskyi]|uniref:Salicylate carboxymethyltransferase n=1 Tax=Heracleum sosnowskyi TaxID=360622 RepID=A0AAD8IMC3_9APIA|nr:Salicylate carboxymethyltransferase [Heracleum sosnowskyi]